MGKSGAEWEKCGKSVKSRAKGEREMGVGNGSREMGEGIGVGKWEREMGEGNG